MKVIFSTDSIKYPLTGIGRYTYELANCFMKSSDISELLFLRGHTLNSLLATAENIPVSSQSLRQSMRKSRIISEIYRLTVPWLKTQVLRKHPDAIYHSPNFYLPPKVGRCVATFHDLSVFTWPHCHPTERVRFMQKELLQTIKRAEVLITDSDFMRKELAEYFNLPLAKVYSAKLASGPEFYPRQPSDITPVISKYNLAVKQYCLFVGSIEPRKNIDTLLDAYEKLPLTLRLRFPLVISGFTGWNSKDLHYRFERAQAAGWLRYLGYTKSTDLPFLFAGARSFLFPSLYEGFGLPVLEAMASGVPVVCSDNSSLPEVIGDCGLTCAAKDVETLAKLIRKSIEDDVWRKNANIKGLDRSKQFSWQRCAQETINAYRQV